MMPAKGRVETPKLQPYPIWKTIGKLSKKV